VRVSPRSHAAVGVTPKSKSILGRLSLRQSRSRAAFVTIRSAADSNIVRLAILSLHVSTPTYLISTSDGRFVFIGDCPSLLRALISASAAAPISALIIGATGATGSHLLRELLASPRYSRVGEFGRRVTPVDSLSTGKDKLTQKSIDFDKLSPDDDQGLRDGKWDVVFITCVHKSFV
jgi:hypothetical protein